MRIKLLTGLAHPENGCNAGDVIDCPHDEAIRHIEAGHAVPHGERQVETPEKASSAIEKRAPAKRRRKKK